MRTRPRHEHAAAIAQAEARTSLAAVESRLGKLTQIATARAEYPTFIRTRLRERALAAESRLGRLGLVDTAAAQAASQHRVPVRKHAIAREKRLSAFGDLAAIHASQLLVAAAWCEQAADGSVHDMLGAACGTRAVPTAVLAGCHTPQSTVFTVNTRLPVAVVAQHLGKRMVALVSGNSLLCSKWEDFHLHLLVGMVYLCLT